MTQSLVVEKKAAKYFGASVRPVGAPRVLCGNTSYVDDLKFPGMVFLSFARSAVPHAHLKKVDIGRTLSEEGVIAAITGEDVVREIAPFPIFASPEGVKPFARYPLAVGKVRYEGEIVAAVVGVSRAVAEDAAETVEVDYDSRDAVLDPRAACESKDSLVIDEWGTNEAYSTELRAGDIGRAFSSSDLVFKETFRIQRQYGSPMEPRGVVAYYDRASESLTVYSSTQWPHVVRTVLSMMLRIGEEKIRVLAPDVGGGFGNKQDVYPEEIIAAYLARRIGWPVKWIASRSEDALSTVHARDQVHSVEVAASRDGTITGFRDEIFSDLGAFHIMSVGPQLVTIGTLSGAYDIRNWEIRLHCAVTNKTPVGAYRGFGASESNFVLERSIDLIARELKLDRARIRQKNLVQRTDFPYRTALGSLYDTGDYADCLRRGLELSSYRTFKERQSDARAKGRLIGIGISFVVESTGIGSSKNMARDGFKVYGGYDNAIVRVERSGTVSVFTGLSPHGQGLDTTLAQICADEFGIGLKEVRVNWGDTQSSPYGFGTWGSRSAITGSSAMKLSIDKVKQKALRIAAHVLKAASRDTVFQEGRFYAKNDPGKSLSLRDVAEAAYGAADLPPEMEPGLEATSFYDPPSPSYAYGVHIPVVEVSPEDGKIIFHSYSVVHDCGSMINPSIVEGQLHGGIAQGIGGALLEELSYSDEGQLLSGNYMDYLLPTSLDVPNISIEHTETPSTMNPFGIKGVGEGGAIAPPAAIASAVEDALSQFGIRITETPITPEKVRALLRK